MSDKKVFDSPTPTDQLRRYGDTVSFDFWYPRIDGHARYLEVGISDVRASDGIRIHYDFDRDGYVIEQESTGDGTDWQETAFVRSWAREAKSGG